MEKIIIFGAGKNAEKIYACLQQDVQIISFIDNNIMKWGSELNGVQITSPNSVVDVDYKYIIIATINYGPVVTQLLKLGAKEKEIITPFAFDHAKYDSWRTIFKIEELIYLEMNIKLERMSLYINNLEYELASKIKKNKISVPQIHSVEETVKVIVQMGKSMSRYGDGEMDIIRGKNLSFQSHNEVLQQRLREILKSDLENHIVCLPDIYGDYENRTDEFKTIFRTHLADGGREKEYEFFDMQKEYYDSFITRPYKDYEDKSDVKGRFDALKSIWQDKDVVIVEGDKSRLGVGNDLFAGVKSCIRILAPSRNAFSKYNELLEEVRKVGKNKLVLLALGPTATVMAYDLAKEGYQSLDIGHIDIEYEWYLHGAEEKMAIAGKYVNEVPDGHDVSDVCEDEMYNAQVIARVL